MKKVINKHIFQAFEERELFPVFVTDIPKNASELLDSIHAVHQLDYICQNFTTWIEDYAKINGHINGSTDEFFDDVMSYMDRYPELVQNVFFTFSR